jgi:hypothetical protein
MASQDYTRVTVKGHPIADANGKSYAHRIALYKAIGQGPHRCHWCEWDGLEWGLDKDPNNLIVDHLDTNYKNDRPENLVPTHKWCNDNKWAVNQLGIPWSEVAKIPPGEREAFYNPGTHKPTAAAHEFAEWLGATVRPDTPAEPSERTPWEALFTVPASLLEKYAFLAEVKP